MKSTVTGLIAAIALAGFAGLLPGAATAQPVVLNGATIYDGLLRDPIREGRIVVVGGMIACIGTKDACRVPEGSDVIDVSGQYISPGLIDAHVHFAQTAWFDGRPDAGDFRDIYPLEQVHAFRKTRPQSYYRAYLCSGITGVFDVGGFPWSWDQRKAAEQSADAPHIAAAGPLVTHGAREILNQPGEKEMVMLGGEDAGRAAARYLKAFGSDAVKIWFLPVRDPERQPDIDARVRAVADEARRLELPVIVHATTLREAKVAVRAGTHLLVHSIFNEPVDEEFIELVRNSGTIYTPTLVVLAGYPRMFQALATGEAPVLDDDGRCAEGYSLEKIEASLSLGDHPTTRAVRENFTPQPSFDPPAAALDNLKRMYDSGVTIVVGTDAGNPGTLHGPSIFGELEAMQSAGIPARDLILMATANGARAMRRNDIGTLTEGKVADLILLSADPGADIRNMRSITHVMRAGILKTRAALARPTD